MKKLHLGCGDMILQGYINCDLYNPRADVKCDALHLPFEDESVDEIYSAHLFEHFDFYEAFKLLEEWKRVLKTGAKLIIETPDLEANCRALVNLPEERRCHLYDQFYGKPWIPGLGHKFLYTEGQLRITLQWMGFKDIVRVPALRYIGMEHLNLKMECTK
jgi:ubiquinone/menaquinone biosynthesis C-methylase UbiE